MTTNNRSHPPDKPRESARPWRTCQIAALCLLLPSAFAWAEQIDMRIRALPPARVGVMHWGATQAGIELGRGSATVEELFGQPRLPPTITVSLSAAPSTEGEAAKLWLCIGQDAWESYAPSFGDQYQVVTPHRDADGWIAIARPDGWQKREATAKENILTVHYHRLDGEYQDAGLWTWDEHLTRAPPDNELLPVGRSDFGLVFQLDIGLYGRPGDGVGLLPRRRADWAFKEGGDRIWKPPLGSTVYLVQDDDRVHSEAPDVSPKVRSVTLDADRHITVRFTHRLPVAEWTPQKFQLTDGQGKSLEIKAVWPFSRDEPTCGTFSLELAERLDFVKHAFELSVDGLGRHKVRVGHILQGSTTYYDADARMGADYQPQRTVFRVFAPGAQGVQVVVADSLETDEHLTLHEMAVRETGIWEATVEGDLEGKYYAYQMRGIGFNAKREVTDIYATCTQARHARSLIVDLRKTDPKGFRDEGFTPAAAADAIIYEMHVRDFTIAPDSGVRHKGNYLGLTESGTTHPDDESLKTGLDHLVEMGVTHVQIMPVHDFDNAETSTDHYNWGYMPVHFNSPDGWYASEAMGPARIRELKTAIQAFHRKGIGVILDVVYNHTADWSSFERLVPGYYHRMTAGGSFSNGSGCGNEFDSANPMARKFIVDSCRFWVEEYRVDGFRFDLMGLIDLETMKQVKAELLKVHPGVLVYGEPWTGGATTLDPITNKHVVRGSGIAAFNDHFRDAIKGGRDGGDPGFIQVGRNRDAIMRGLAGAIDDWSLDPLDSINYFEAHDNLTAWDKLLQSAPEAPDDVKRRMMRFASLILFSSQGIVFMHSGQEFCRTKQGSHNSYNLPDEINRIDWLRKKEYADVVAYHRGLIALRKAQPALRLASAAAVRKRVTFSPAPNDQSIVYRIDAAGLEGEADTSIRTPHGSGGPLVGESVQAPTEGGIPSPDPNRDREGAASAPPSDPNRDRKGAASALPPEQSRTREEAEPPVRESFLAPTDVRTVLVLLNGATEPTRFDLPPGPWKIRADAGRASAEPFAETTGEVELPAHSGMFLTQTLP